MFAVVLIFAARLFEMQFGIEGIDELATMSLPQFQGAVILVKSLLAR